MRQEQDKGTDVEEVYGVSVHVQYQIVHGHREELERIVRDLEDQVNKELRD
jgi:hypothetical protein